MEKLKLKYNKLLERQNNAEVYFNAPGRTEQEIKTHWKDYQVILKQINKLIEDAKKLGYTMTHTEIVGGFTVD